jgi:acyl-CoA thioester hydrolase
VTPVFTHQLAVRFRDCDPMGHVNNAVYLTYLEQARFHHWRAAAVVRHTIASEAAANAAAPPDIPGVIVARVEIDYRRAAKYGDLLRIDLGVAAIGRTSFTYEYEIRDTTNALVVSAKTVIVRFDYAAGKPVPISDELKAALTRKLTDGSEPLPQADGGVGANGSQNGATEPTK